MNLKDYEYYRTDLGILYHGDCLEIIPQLASVDLVLTDPPYGIELGNTSGSGGKHGLKINNYDEYSDTYENFVELIVPRLKLSIGKAKRAAIFSGPHIHEQSKPDAIGGIHCPAGCGRNRWGFKTYLPVLFYGTAPSLNLGGKPISIQSTAITEKNGHPCPKPIQWVTWLLNLSSLIGDIVLDPFIGSGTTAVACEQLNRRWVGIEISEKYCEIAAKRIERERQQLKLFDPPAEVPRLKQASIFHARQLPDLNAGVKNEKHNKIKESMEAASGFEAENSYKTGEK